jgi:hypothetical protein
MAADRVRVYSVAELERLATDYLTGQFGADVLIPVDVDLLVEKAENTTLDVWPKLQANHQVLGMVLRDVDSGELFIFIDEDLADNDTPNGRARYRMTVAEELAHVRLRPMSASTAASSTRSRAPTISEGSTATPSERRSSETRRSSRQCFSCRPDRSWSMRGRSMARSSANPRSASS